MAQSKLAELAFDPKKAVARLRRVDAHLADVIRQTGPFTHRPEKMQSPFQTLLRAIVYQQLSGKAAATIHRPRCRLYPPARDRPSPPTCWPRRTPKLRAAGMSQAKVQAVKDLAAKTLDGTVPTLAKLVKMSDEEIVSRLVRSARHRRVERRDAADLSARPARCAADQRSGRAQGVSSSPTHWTNCPRRKMLESRRALAPVSLVASWYMWRAVDLANDAAQDSKPALP